MKALRTPRSLLLALALAACAEVDPDGGSSSDLLEMGEPNVGTESGNPTEGPTELPSGTESGNPSLVEPEPAMETGTESGNPTRPPGPSAVPEVTVPIGDGVDAEPTAVPESSVDEPEPTEVGTMSPTTATPPMGTAPPPGSTEPPQAPSAGVGGLCDEQTCAADAAARASTYTQALPAPAAFAATSCSDTGECTCSRDQDIVLRSGEPGECLLPGRLGCLYTTDEYSVCSSEDPATCAASCEAVHVREQADAMGIEVSVRASACTGVSCRFVLQTDSACFVGGSDIAPEERDCALSDDELLNSR